MKLAATFPRARQIIGVDLSPHMLAVARYNLGRREEQGQARGRVQYMHAAGEMTGLADSSMDLVSLSLTSHELPAEATRWVLPGAPTSLRVVMSYEASSGIGPNTCQARRLRDGVGDSLSRPPYPAGGAAAESCTLWQHRKHHDRDLPVFLVARPVCGHPETTVGAGRVYTLGMECYPFFFLSLAPAPSPSMTHVHSEGRSWDSRVDYRSG